MNRRNSWQAKLVMTVSPLNSGNLEYHRSRLCSGERACEVGSGDDFSTRSIPQVPPFSRTWGDRASARACASGSGEEASLHSLVFRSLRHKHAGRDLLTPHRVELLDRRTARLFHQRRWISIARLWVDQLARLLTRGISWCGPYLRPPEIETGAQRRVPAAGASRSGEEASQHSLGPAPSGTRCRHERCHDESSLPPQTEVR